MLDYLKYSGTRGHESGRRTDSWILDFEKIDWFWILLIILNSGYWKKYRRILDFWKKNAWICGIFIGFGFSKNCSRIPDFGKNFWIQGSSQLPPRQFKKS